MHILDESKYICLLYIFSYAQESNQESILAHSANKKRNKLKKNKKISRVLNKMRRFI